MTQADNQASFSPRVLGILALVLIAAIAFVLIRTSITRQEYNTLLNTTAKPTLSPPVLSFQATDALFRMGSIGPEVIRLQERLKALDYYQGELDGQYGRATQEAISRFQTQNGLEADGMAGALTLSVLNSPDARPASAQPLVTSAPPAQQGEPTYNPG